MCIILYKLDLCRDARNEVMSTKTNEKDVFGKEDDMPLFVYAFSHKAALSKGETNSALCNFYSFLQLCVCIYTCIYIYFRDIASCFQNLSPRLVL